MKCVKALGTLNTVSVLIRGMRTFGMAFEILDVLPRTTHMGSRDRNGTLKIG
jgi:hypothetical protein